MSQFTSKIKILILNIEPPAILGHQAYKTFGDEYILLT